MAKKSGAEVAIHATREDVIQRVLEETNGEGVDYVIPTAAAPVLFDQAMQTVRKGGTVLLYGIMSPGTKVEFDIFPFWKKQVKLLSTYAAAPRDLARADPRRPGAGGRHDHPPPAASRNPKGLRAGGRRRRLDEGNHRTAKVVPLIRSSAPVA